MTVNWAEHRSELCSKIENDFNIPTFKNRDYPIVALTSNDKITQDAEFHKYMKIDGQKDLATIGDTIIDFLIIEHFLEEKSQKSAHALNTLREKYGKNRTLHLVSKTPDVNLKNYIIGTDNDRCWETGKTCLAVYFEALVAIIFIENGIDEVKKFLQKISFFEIVKILYETN
jgi:dsRNA-specific ribonuclease